MLLGVLSIIEEMVVDVWHGSPVREALTGFAGGALLRVLAASLLTLLILISYFTFREIAHGPGEGKLLKLLTAPGVPDMDD